jgi:predicted transcriptional regulator
MQVREIMSKRPVTVGEHEPVRTAAELMVEEQIGSVIVTRQGNAKPYKVGILTKDDVLELECDQEATPGKRSTLARLLDRLRSSSSSPLDDVTVGDVMSSTLVTVSPKMSVEDVVKRMQAEDVHYVVVTEKLQAIGIVTPTDVMEYHPEAVELARRLGGRGPDWGDQ